jgi:NAD(P)-dependent dehydrogenase (short-subunit alcohol dehydrogenase family)
MAQAQVAIVTGAGQGIGAGVARSFAEAGYKVSLMSPSERNVAPGEPRATPRAPRGARAGRRAWGC